MNRRLCLPPCARGAGEWCRATTGDVDAEDLLESLRGFASEALFSHRKQKSAALAKPRSDARDPRRKRRLYSLGFYVVLKSPQAGRCIARPAG